MSLQWTIVAAFLYMEIAICLLLCLPFISPKRWQFVFKSRLFALLVAYGNIYFLVVVSILVLLFLDAVREVRKYSLPDSEKVNLSNNPNAQDHVLMMLFRAQRNLYISGFALFLFLVLRRFVILISNSAQLEANSEATRRQAESASRAAEELMNRNESGDSADSDETKKLKKEVDGLKSKLVEARKEAQAAKTDKEAMKSQAESVKREYDRLMEEMANLQNELNEGNKKDD